MAPVRFHDLAELGRKTEGAHDWLALIVGAETIAREGPELVARLRALAQPLPVIYLSSDGLPKIAESSGDLAWLHLELPVKQRRLSAVLNQAQNVRNGHPTQPGTYRFRPSGDFRSDARHSPAGRASGALRHQRAHPRRVRHRQGDGRAPCPRVVGPLGPPLRAGQLRRDSGGLAGERAVRSRERRVHRAP